MKTIKNLVKKAFDAYCKGVSAIYKPCYDAGIDPFKAV